MKKMPFDVHINYRIIVLTYFYCKKRTKSFRMPELSIDILFQHFEFERQQFSIERYLVYPLIPHGFTLIDHFFLSLFYSSPPHSQSSTHTKTEMILIIVFFSLSNRWCDWLVERMFFSTNFHYFNHFAIDRKYFRSKRENPFPLSERRYLSRSSEKAHSTNPF